MNTEQTNTTIMIDNMVSLRGLIYGGLYKHVDDRITPERLFSATSHRANNHLEFSKRYQVEVMLLPVQKGIKLKHIEIPIGYRKPFMVEFLYFISMYAQDESSTYRRVWDGKARGKILLCGDLIDIGSLFALNLCWQGSRYSNVTRGLGLTEYFDEPLGEHDWLLWVKK